MLIGIDASRAVAARPTGTEGYSRQLIQALLELAGRQTSVRYRFRLYFRGTPPADLFPGVGLDRADLAVIPFPRLWTHVRLSWEMARRPPDVLFIPAHEMGTP